MKENRHTSDTFRIQVIGSFKLYGAYCSRRELDTYIKRVGHLTRDWWAATESFHRSINRNDQIPSPEDVARYCAADCTRAPTHRPNMNIYGHDDPREAIIKALSLGDFGHIYSGLKKAKASGKNEVAACCPFHNDKNPSMNYNTESGLWICRAGCGGGSAFDYEMAMTGESFGEVLNRLAWELGIELQPKPRKNMRFKNGDKA